MAGLQPTPKPGIQLTGKRFTDLRELVRINLIIQLIKSALISDMAMTSGLSRPLQLNQVCQRCDPSRSLLWKPLNGGHTSLRQGLHRRSRPRRFRRPRLDLYKEQLKQLWG